MKSAPTGFTAYPVLLNRGKEFAIAKVREQIRASSMKKKYLRHIELALQNAAERGISNFHTPLERDLYRRTLEILSVADSEAFHLEALQLFTLSDKPDLSLLAEKYNLSQRITALAHGTIHQEVDVAPYLNSFFEALVVELYNDPMFREQISGVIYTRAALQGQQSLQDIVTMLTSIYHNLAANYT